MLRSSRRLVSAVSHVSPALRVSLIVVIMVSAQTIIVRAVNASIVLRAILAESSQQYFSRLRVAFVELSIVIPWRLRKPSTLRRRRWICMRIGSSNITSPPTSPRSQRTISASLLSTNIWRKPRRRMMMRLWRALKPRLRRLLRSGRYSARQLRTLRSGLWSTLKPMRSFILALDNCLQRQFCLMMALWY